MMVVVLSTIGDKLLIEGLSKNVRERVCAITTEATNQKEVEGFGKIKN